MPPMPQLRAKQLSGFPLWTALWTVLLACAWLLPNHYRPWGSFHAEAWCAAMMVCMLIGLAWSARQAVGVPTVALLLMGMAVVVWLQFAAGVLAFSGQAWLVSGYFALAGLTWMAASQWEQRTANQGLDALMVAIATAAVVSVGLQLDQWLQTDLLELWSMGGDGTRPYANMGQPNLLSTFLLWGLLALWWASERHWVGGVTAALAALVLLFGMALTQSRTGWLGLLLVAAAVWLWRRHWRWPQLPWVTLALGLWFVACVSGLQRLSTGLQVAVPPSLDGRMAMGGDLRLAAWKLLFESSLERPWLGYGVGNVFLAQIEAPTSSTPIYQAFGHAHNLLLDAVLGLGWPLGLLVVGWLLVWVWRSMRRVADAKQAILILFVLVVGVHAGLELPLHHAHFLLPMCMVMGGLQARQGVANALRCPVWLYRAAATVSLAVLALVAHDYLRAEESFYKLRFEWNRVGREAPGTPPDVVLLNQLHEWIKFLRYEPQANMSEAQLQWMRDVSITFAASGNFYSLARALALNGYPQEAALRLRQMCNAFDAQQCHMNQHAWVQGAKTQPAYAAVNWPEKKD